MWRGSRLDAKIILPQLALLVNPKMQKESEKNFCAVQSRKDDQRQKAVEPCRTERLAVHNVENAGSLVGKDVKIQKEGEKFSTFVMGKIR